MMNEQPIPPESQAQGSGDDKLRKPLPSEEFAFDPQSTDPDPGTPEDHSGDSFENDLFSAVSSVRDRVRDKNMICGILFAMGDSVSVSQIAHALEADAGYAEELLVELQKEMDDTESGIRLTRLEDAWQMCTSEQVYPHLIRIARQPRRHALTEVLLETLAIVAYKQPVTKSEIEKIRGVSSDHAVNKLVEYELIAEIGRLDAPGRPMLFGTTEQFLRAFHVSSVADLPSLNPVQVEEFRLEAENEAEKLVVDV